MVPRFAMFYADGSVVLDDGEDVEVVWRVPRKWHEAPADGLQAVMVHRPDGRLRNHDSRDVYAVLQNGEPMATDDIGPLLRAAGIVKYGLWIPDEEWERVRDRVRAYRKEHEEKEKR